MSIFQKKALGSVKCKSLSVRVSMICFIFSEDYF